MRNPLRAEREQALDDPFRDLVERAVEVVCHDPVGNMIVLQQT